jgi:hypothetical protein
MLTPLASDEKPAAPARPEAPSAAGAPMAWPLTGPQPKAEPRRYYLAYGISRGGNRGAASPRPAVPLTAPPAAPEQPRLEVTERGVTVSWAVPPGARLPYQEPAEGGVLRSTSRGMESAPPLAYVVYGVRRGPAGAPAGAAGPSAGAVRLTGQPVTGLTWTDGSAEFGVDVCYDVRSVLTQGAVSIESGASPRACVTPVDTFPPPAPSALVAVAGEGAISLIWEGVAAPDLAGYLVLRADAPDGTLAPLFDAPVRETTYRDTTARPGVRYVYAVVAVDRATPGNRSALSNKVEERAR